MNKRQISCALLSPQPYWPGEVAIACPGLEMFAFAPGALGRIDMHNPFGLPETDRVDVALVGSWWYVWLEHHYPDQVDDVIRRLEQSAEVVVGINGSDRFNLGFPPHAIERFASVLCMQGLYRDRDLYNWNVGPVYPGANWTEKRERRQWRYGSDHLDKLRLSVPCFVTQFPGVRRRTAEWVREDGRRWTRNARSLGQPLANRVMMAGLGVAPRLGRSLEVHCHLGLSHVQRIETLRLLEGFSGVRGIAPTQSPALVYGTEYGGATLPLAVQKKLTDHARPFARDPVSRQRYLLIMRRHKIGVAPTGYGEVGDRHGQVLMTGAALVCQDLSHVEMLLPFIDRQNAFFCRPDLSDLRELVEDVLRDDALRIRVARQGRGDFVKWARDWRRHLLDGFEGPIRESLWAA